MRESFLGEKDRNALLQAVLEPLRSAINLGSLKSVSKHLGGGGDVPGYRLPCVLFALWNLFPLVQEEKFQAFTMRCTRLGLRSLLAIYKHKVTYKKVAYRWVKCCDKPVSLKSCFINMHKLIINSFPDLAEQSSLTGYMCIADTNFAQGDFNEEVLHDLFEDNEIDSCIYIQPGSGIPCCGLGITEFSDAPLPQAYCEKVRDWFNNKLTYSKRRVANIVDTSAIWPGKPPLSMSNSLRLNRQGKLVITATWRLLLLLEKLRLLCTPYDLVYLCPQVGSIFKTILCKYSLSDPIYSCSWQNSAQLEKRLRRIQVYLSTCVRISRKQ